MSDGEKGENGAGFSSTREDMVVREETMTEHTAEGVKSGEREIILSERRDEGAPSGCGFVGRIVEELERRER